MPAENISSGKPGSTWWLAAAMIFVLGVFLRLYRVGQQIILDDEWHALNVVQDHDYAWIFSHLGHADHSIPMALLYEFFSHSIGLGEMSMRLPSLLAGIAAMAILPWLWRRWLTRPELLLMTGLAAISPFLINYSRIARPYVLLTLLGGASVILAWRWWQSASGDEPGRRIYGFAWFSCAVLAAWVNPVSLAVTTGPFLWFTGCAAGSLLRRRNYKPLLRVAVLGLSVLAGVAALMVTPLSNDFSSLAVKTGFHTVGAGAFIEAASLFSGSGHAMVVLGMLAAAAWGWISLYRRDREFALYLLLVTVAATVAVSLTGAAWIIYGLILARYLIGLLPVFLALAAIGAVQAYLRISAPLRPGAASGQIAIVLVLLGLFFAGPLPHADAGRSQFVHHAAVQFDYDFERNPVRAALSPIIPEPFYAEIAELHPDGDALVVEAPWYLESNWNALPLYQAVHGQQVMVGFIGGLCAGKLYGELSEDSGLFEFDQFIPVQQVLDGAVTADFLVLRRQAPPGAREIPMDFDHCERAARAALGDPWRTTGSALVFRISGAS